LRTDLARWSKRLPTSRPASEIRKLKEGLVFAMERKNTLSGPARQEIAILGK
jgi:hypothetical protein